MYFLVQELCIRECENRQKRNCAGRNKSVSRIVTVRCSLLMLRVLFAGRASISYPGPSFSKRSLIDSPTQSPASVPLALLRNAGVAADVDEAGAAAAAAAAAVAQTAVAQTAVAVAVAVVAAHSASSSPPPPSSPHPSKHHPKASTHPSTSSPGSAAAEAAGAEEA